MIAGLEDITEGELYIDQNLVNDIAPKDRDIAMVFQNYALYPHMTVYDNMAFGLKLRKYDKADIDKRVQEAAEILGLKELLDRKPADLSGGQRQRVAMGRRLFVMPKSSLWMSPCLTWMLNCACPCGQKSQKFTAVSERRLSM